MKDQYYIVCFYHGFVHYCWLWQREWNKFTKKDSVVEFSRVPKLVKNEGEVIEELTTRRRRAWSSAISRDDLTDDKLEKWEGLFWAYCVWPSWQTVGSICTYTWWLVCCTVFWRVHYLLIICCVQIRRETGAALWWTDWSESAVPSQILVHLWYHLTECCFNNNYCLHVCVLPHPRQSINMFKSYSIRHRLKLFFF